MLVIDLAQGSPEWFHEKAGKPSASNCSKIITNSGTPSKQAEDYLYELAAERVVGKAEESYKNACMEEGMRRESEARNLFELINSVKVDTVGVVYKDKKKRFLCSPDGFIGGKEGVEIKNPLAKTQVKYLLDGEVPTQYFSQIQFSLYVTGLELWHFFSYVPSMPPLHIKVQRDEKFIEAIAVALDSFCCRLDKITQKIGG